MLEVVIAVAAIYGVYLTLAGVFAQVFSPKDESVAAKALFFLALAFLVPGLIVLVWWAGQRSIKLLSRIADTLENVRHMLDKLDSVTAKLIKSIDEARLVEALESTGDAARELRGAISEIDARAINEAIGLLQPVLEDLRSMQIRIGKHRLLDMVSRTEQLLADFARMRELMNRRYSLDDIASTAAAGIAAARDYELLKAEVRAELNEITGLLADIRRSMLVPSSPQT